MGNKDWGALGDGYEDGYSSTPDYVKGLRDIIEISSNYKHTCALTQSGTVKCWGLNNYGQLGNGIKSYSNIPIDVTGITGATGVVASSAGTVAFLSDNSLLNWGRIDNSQEISATPLPTAANGLNGATAIRMGYFHSCALMGNGTVKCWGHNTDGQLGNGTYANSFTPIEVSGLSNVTAISSGFNHNCALISGGAVKCWGYNYYGQLGNGSNTKSNAPVAVSGVA